MANIKFYKEDTGNFGYWNQSGVYTGKSACSCYMHINGTSITIPQLFGFKDVEVTDIQKSSTLGDNYATVDEFKEAVKDFFVKASSDGGDSETPTILTQSGSNSMAVGILVKARSVTITAGTWIVTGNIFCDGDTLSSGYAKAALNLANNTFTTNETTQVDIDSNENDFGFSVMPLPITVTEDTTVFLNFAREIGTTAVSLYSKIQAIKIG